MKLPIFILISLCLITGCVPHFTGSTITHPEYKMLREMSDREQEHLVFSKYPSEKQLDIHLAAISQSMPPDLSFVIGLTMHREKMFPVLISQIELDKKEGSAKEIMICCNS